MRMRVTLRALVVRLFVTGAVVATTSTTGFAAEPSAPTIVDGGGRYHGFVVEGVDAARLDAEHPSLARQIGIVESVDLPADVLAFFRRVPIRVDPDLPRPPGQFVADGRGGHVRILADGLHADRPILLHELLHALHADVIGHDDPTIRRAFDAAKRGAMYPARYDGAHFLENANEYFAVTSTIFLFGPIGQPPFDCTVLKTSQAEYLAFLATRLGPHACR